jgi:hypothetical protein
MDLKRYSFIFKPLFFIFSLLFATALVLKIEEIQPSDFGERQHFITPNAKNQDGVLPDKKQLKRLYIEYLSGKIDSTQLLKKLDLLFEETEKSKVSRK